MNDVSLYKQLNNMIMYLPIRVVKKKMIDLDVLILTLIKEREKGGKTVKFNGTLLVVETGNTVILTTEKQM